MCNMIDTANKPFLGFFTSSHLIHPRSSTKHSTASQTVAIFILAISKRGTSKHFRSSNSRNLIVRFLVKHKRNTNIPGTLQDSIHETFRWSAVVPLWDVVGTIRTIRWWPRFDVIHTTPAFEPSKKWWNRTWLYARNKILTF